MYYKKLQKGSVNIWLVVTVTIIFVAVSFVFIRQLKITNQENSFVIKSIPSITLLSPIGGENWKIGSVQTIKWHTAGIPIGSQISISFVLGGSINKKGRLVVVSSKGEDDSLQFIVPNEVQVIQGDDYPLGIPLIQGQYKILVESYADKNHPVYGISKDFFTISTNSHIFKR